MSELLNTDNLRAAAEEYNKNFKWFMDNQDLVKSHSKGKFVAVHNSRLYASENHDNLLIILEKSGITSTDSVFKTYVPDTDDVFAMSSFC
ncbi:MAG TPA: hypothetical protein VFS97_02315 [Nitrososphaeraceae archaeon]|nr:hypothetical protein [Nitrososphaeraceae archaeon]